MHLLSDPTNLIGVSYKIIAAPVIGIGGMVILHKVLCEKCRNAEKRLTKSAKIFLSLKLNKEVFNGFNEAAQCELRNLVFNVCGVTLLSVLTIHYY